MKLMSKQRIKECNMEIINNSKVIDVSWFQDKAVSYTCCSTIAFLFRLGKLKDIANYEDLDMKVPEFGSNFKEIGEKISLSTSKEKEWERIYESLQMYAFDSLDGKHFIDVLQLVKLLNIIIPINHPARLSRFVESYKDLSCKGIIEELLKNNQIQFTSENAMYCFEEYFKNLNAVMFEQVIKAIPSDTESMGYSRE